jgi:hypothetical protein
VNHAFSFEVGERGTQKTTTPQVLSPLNLYYNTLPSWVLSLGPFRAPQPATTKGWTAPPSPLLESGPGSENFLSL